MLLEEQNSISFFFLQNCRLKYLFIYLFIFFCSNWKQFLFFKIAHFEFKVTVHYMAYGKNTQMGHLKEVLHL